MVSFAPSTLHPGDVVRVDVDGAGNSERITATVLGQDLAFHYDPRQRRYQALVGIDLDTKPDAYPLRIHRNGTPEAATATLRILPKQFAGATPQRAWQLRRAAGGCPRTNPARQRDARRRVRARVGQEMGGRLPSPCGRKADEQLRDAQLLQRPATLTACGRGFRGKPGTPIRAANRGEIVVAAPMYFTGNTVVVDYGDRLFSVFAHLSEIHVKTGDMVEPTTVVGLVGATGRVTGPHLHWSVRLNGARVDPLSLVAATSGAP